LFAEAKTVCNDPSLRDEAAGVFQHDAVRASFSIHQFCCIPNHSQNGILTIAETPVRVFEACI
jgi:hypothetical protein